jgi:RNA polymerase sigma factor (sigma-70 family)
MSSADDFAVLVEKVRGGDEDAARDLFERYHKVLIRTVKMRLDNTILQAQVDVADIVQTVFKSLFVRLRLKEEQYDLADEKNLINLILRMAHNKLTAKQRRHHARPDARRTGEEFDSQIEGTGDRSPSEILSAKELLEEALKRMTEEERQILHLRDQKVEWVGIAARLGGTAEGRRKQWERARARIAEELQLEE